VNEQMIRTQQVTLLTAMRAQLKALQDAAAAAAAAKAATKALSGGVSGVSSTVSVLDDEALLKIARLTNVIAEIKYESQQEVPLKLTSEEASLYSNEMKTYSLRVATLEKHCGQVFALIVGQCIQHTTPAPQDEAGKEVGGGGCFLRSTRALQAHRECRPQAQADRGSVYCGCYVGPV